MASNYVIVISVLKGNNFPTRHDKNLLVEAKFDNEVMSTDPVSHLMCPNFNTELAWEVDKKGLQMHRLQRSPIKLQWYAIDLDLSKKETIGYMVLDIRLAQEKQQHQKWYPLLNSKYQREKPEVLMSLYLERVAEDSYSNTPSAYSSRRNSLNQDKMSYKKATVHSSKSVRQSPKIPSSMHSVLKPVLLSEAGCYQIGPPELCTDYFMFSITLAFAANLNKLTPPAMLKSSRGFHFYYSLFDNDVTTEKFSTLSNPDFLAGRASVRISSSSIILSQYFQHHPNLEILLCSGDVPLGSGLIPLSPLSCVNKHDLQKEPLCVEGSVQIVPTEKTSRCGGDVSPFVGVTVVLQNDKAEVQSDGSKDDHTPVHEDSSAKESLRSRRPSPSEKEKKSFIPKSSSINEERPPSQAKKTGLPRQESTVLTEHSSDSYNHSSDNNSPEEVRDPASIVSPPSSLPMKVDSSAHHFSFSLDLRNFKATRLAHPINLFIRYSYPFFGTTSSMVTHPDVDIHPKREVSIPHGYCSFNFATTFTLLKSTFWETPLLLEVLHHKKGGQEQLVGTARINLFQVLDATCVSHSVDKKRGMRRMSTCKVVVTSPEGYEIGEIYATLTLIDFGTTSSLCDHHSSKTDISCFNETKPRNCVPNFSLPLLRQNGLTQDELLQAALELELWQERQRELFRAQLKDKEMQHLSVLTSELKQRDMEREMMAQRRLQECKKVEDNLKILLKDAEIKAKQFSSQEAELNMRMLKLDKQREQQEKEAKSQIESVRMEYNELLSRERMNGRVLEQKNNTYLLQIKELERNVQEQRSLIDALKSQAGRDPDVQLRTEVNILNMEKAELQQKLETALNSKEKYKYQWGKAVKQISYLQQKVHEMECLEKEKKERITSFKQKILSNEEKVTAHANEVLDMVNDKVESLKSLVSPESIQLQMRQISLTPETPPTTHYANHTSSPSPKSVTPNKITPQSHIPVRSPCFNKSNAKDLNGNSTTAKENNGQLQNLLTEKDELLSKSGYTEQHKLIKELNSHIEKVKQTFQ